MTQTRAESCDWCDNEGRWAQFMDTSLRTPSAQVSEEDLARVEALANEMLNNPYERERWAEDATEDEVLDIAAALTRVLASLQPPSDPTPEAELSICEGCDELTVVCDCPTPEGRVEAYALERARKFADWLEQQPNLNAGECLNLRSVLAKVEPAPPAPSSPGGEARGDELPRMALRPYHDDEERLDDVVVENVEMFRAEMMDDGHLWMACYFGEGRDDLHFSVIAGKTGRAQLHLSATDVPPHIDIDAESTRALSPEGES